MEDKFFVHCLGDNDYYYDNCDNDYCFKGTQVECEDYIKRATNSEETPKFNNSYLNVILDRLIDDVGHLEILYMGKEVAKVTTNNEAETITFYTNAGDYTYSYPVFLNMIADGKLTILED